MYAIFIGLIIVSDSIYPGDYSFFTNSVSNLGNPFLNPFPGWFLFSTALWSFGFLALPLFLFQTRRLIAGQRHFGILFLVLSSIACAGSVGVGLFSEVAATNDAHVVTAVMAFGGLFLSAFMSWVPCLVIATRSPNRSLKILRFAITVAQMLVIAFTATVTGTVYAQEKILHSIGVGFLSITFWEWMLLFSLGIHIFLLTFNMNLAGR